MPSRAFAGRASVAGAVWRRARPQEDWPPPRQLVSTDQGHKQNGAECRKMNVLYATSEAVPFAKTGGLADVLGALPVEVARQGANVCLFLPAYRQALACGRKIEPTGIDLSIPIGAKTVEGTLLASTLPDSDVPVYLVQQDDYYNRDQLYGIDGADFVDNCERFVFFSRAVLDAIRALRLEVDVVHCNDWQTALIPAYLKAEYRGVPGYERIASLFTIHNLAYQGQFWHWDMLLTGLDWKYFNWRQMEFYGKLNLLKTGLVFADALGTVSPRYAQEIQTPAQGCGLEGVLQQRRDDLSGIVNGVDYKVWNPATDPHLPRTYNERTVLEGKAASKAALQAELGLATEPRTPLIGLVGRLIDQKGIDLVAAVLQDWVPATHVQWAILGTGDPKYQKILASLAAQHPLKVAVKFGFSEPLAHRIEAGADIFLMPSHFEPCGLSQLYSLKYGTAPLVRSTGGLANTVTDATPETLANGTATGFCFDEYRVSALDGALRRACETYAQPETWSQIIANGMRQDWSWARSAREYLALYRKTLAAAHRSETVGAT